MPLIPMYIGRFAPSPTDLLHFGSLVTAVASYLEARSQAGQWLLRIEDIDPPRTVHGATDLILKTLCMLGFEWDGPVIFQGQRTLYYQAALNILAEQKLSYACNCNRRQPAPRIQALAVMLSLIYQQKPAQLEL